MSDSLLDFQDEKEGIDLKELISFTKRNFKIITSVASIITIVTIIYSLLLTPVFRAEVVAIPSVGILSQSGGSTTARLASLAGISLPGGSDANTTTAISLAESIKFNSMFIKDQNLLPRLFSNDWDEKNNTWKEDSEPTDLGAVSTFKDHYAIDFDKRDSIITFTVFWDNPKDAAELANEFVAAINSYIQQDAIDEAERSIEYLKNELSTTDLLETKTALFNLIESQMGKIMMANVKKDYAFKIIDPALPPLRRISPARTQMTIIGGVLGLILGFLFAFLRENNFFRHIFDIINDDST